MSRYDWPAPAGGRDDPAARSGHLTRIRPTAGVRPVPLEEPGRPAVRVAPAAGTANLWFPIGPSAMVNGQATGYPDVAGRIRDLQVSPDGSRIYAASATGGLWYSADRGDSWRPLDEWRQSPDLADVGSVANALACGAVHVGTWGANPDGSLDDVWVGTGELTGGAGPLPGGQVRGIGFLHGTGGTWTPVKGDPVSADPTTLRGHTIMRIVADPGDPATLVAATSNGVYVLSGGTWTRVTASLPGGLYTIDVLVTRPAAGTARIWVAGYSTLRFADVPAPIVPATVTTLTDLPLPNVLKVPPRPPAPPAPTEPATRIALAAAPDGTSLYVLGRRMTADTEKLKQKAAHLWRVNAASSPPTVTELPGLPAYLFGEKNDQSGYDMCVAAHPTVAGRIYAGGSGLTTSGEWNAALYRVETTATACTATLIGVGVHADEHVIRIGPATGTPPKHTVWVGCDGGLFRSDADGDPGSFVPRNNGLAVLEPGYVASHPTNAGLVAAGFQDNGTAVRTGDTVWEQSFRGDGGGLVYDPAAPAPGRYFRQYTRADWQSSPPGSVQPVQRHGARQIGTMKTSESIEDVAASFYSGADAIAVGGDTHLVIGSTRVWYSRDWGRSWVTLPTGTDPRGGDNPNMLQDVLFDPAPGTTTAFGDRTGSTECCSTDHFGRAAEGKGIIAVKFATVSAAGTLTLRCYALGQAGLMVLSSTRAAAGSGAFATPWTRTALVFGIPATGSSQHAAFVAGDPVSQLPVDDHAKVSDIAVQDPAAGSVYVTTTGRADFGSSPGDRIDTLWFYDGTGLWYPTGLRTTNPNGTWTGVRVTAPALGVVVDPDDAKIVYVATSVGVVKGVLTVTPGPPPAYAWSWEQFVNGLPEGAVQDLSIHKYPRTPAATVPTVKLLRAALQARGVWETDLANAVVHPLTYLRLYPTDTRRRLPTPLFGDPTAGEVSPPRWDASPDIVIDSGGSPLSTPTEMELYRLPKDRPGTRVQARLSHRRPVVHVLVHHRWRDPAPAADVRVTLVRHVLPANGVVPLGGLWAALVAAAGAAAPPAALPDGWTAAATQLWKNPGAPVDNRLPRSVSFSLDLTGDPRGTRAVLLAVVMSGSNQIAAADARLPDGSNATTVEQLVTHSPHAAAKTIEITT